MSSIFQNRHLIHALNLGGKRKVKCEIQHRVKVNVVAKRTSHLTRINSLSNAEIEKCC